MERRVRTTTEKSVITVDDDINGLKSRRRDGNSVSTTAETAKLATPEFSTRLPENLTTTTDEEAEEEKKEVQEIVELSTTSETEKVEWRRKVTTSSPLINTSTISVESTTEDVTNGTKCQDQFSRCYGIGYLCKNKLYEKIMTTSCAKTCGFCKEFVRLPMPERCRDTYPEDCKIWGDNGFCHAYFYTMPEKVESCMKTCGLC